MKGALIVLFLIPVQDIGELHRQPCWQKKLSSFLLCDCNELVLDKVVEGLRYAE